ncbi:MAG: sigma-54-dependent Fis family transcriptional regulator [Calditrichaeota bacterium]|nr:sigma-54-dependent Fis family transcriptional regulator [Calditrichota bacterium]
MDERILIVEDDLNTLEGLAEILSEEKFEVSKAKNGRIALEEVQKGNFNIVLMDYLLPDRDGLEISRIILERHPEIKIIMMTAFGSVKNAVEAMKLGIYDYLTKPIDLDELLIVINRAIKEQQLITENLDLRDKLQQTYSFDNIIGVSGKMQEIFKKILKVAVTDATVLIRGDSGTGKELIARAVHFQSARSSQPLIEINCASIPETLLESELFGHEKGAFTGAYKSKKGKFELAHRGSIFLDEIGELPLGVQAKLLRVLQDRSFTRVGGIENIEVNVRLIAASNKNLENAMEKGLFREDLYYRLNVIPIFIPPLRERPEDIGPLTDYFLKKYAAKNNKEISGITPEAMDILLQYHWPGNIRELENSLENAIVMTESSIINKTDLPGYLQSQDSEKSAGSFRLSEVLKANENIPFREQLQMCEREIIRRALKDSEGNKTHAARKLGFSLRTLRNKLQRFNLQEE